MTRIGQLPLDVLDWNRRTEHIQPKSKWSMSTTPLVGIDLVAFLAVELSIARDWSTVLDLQCRFSTEYLRLTPIDPLMQETR